MDSDTMHLKKVALLQELLHGRRRSSLVDVLGGEVIRQVQDLPSDPVFVGQRVERFNNLWCVKPGVRDPWQLAL